MSVDVNGTSVATSYELEAMEKRLRGLITDLTRSTEDGFSRVQDKINDLKKLTDKLTTRLQTQEQELKKVRELVDQEIQRLDSILETISAETVQSTVYLKQVNSHMAANKDAVSQLAGSIRDEIQIEVERRKENLKQLDALVDRQKQQSEAMQAIFQVIQTQFNDLIKGQEEQGRSFGSAASQISAAVESTEVHLHEQLETLIKSVQNYTQETAQQAASEQAQLGQLLDTQTQINQTFAQTRSHMEHLAQTGQQAQASRSASLEQARRDTALQLNREAAGYSQSGAYTTALGLLEQAADLWDDPTILANLATAYLRCGQPAPAEMIMARLEASGEHRYAVAYEMGMYYFSQDCQAEAVQAFQKAVTADADRPQGWLALGQASYQNGDLPAAVAAWKRFRALDPLLTGAGERLRLLLEEQDIMEAQP